MDQATLSVLAAAAKTCGCSSEELDRFTHHLHALPTFQAARINPITFAEAAGMPTERALDLFVHGAKQGVFDLEWGMVCPLCGAITHSVPALDQVAEDVVHCALCQKDAPSVLDDTVEVNFAYVPAGAALQLHDDFTAYQHFFTSESYPYRDHWHSYHLRHTVGDVKLEPGETGALSFQTKAGETYRLLCLDTHSGGTVQAVPASDAPGQASSATVSLSDAGFSQSHFTLPAGAAALEITNDTEQPVWCRMLRIDMNDVMAIVSQGMPQFGPRLTGKHLLNNQAFRDNFALHELAPDLKLKLRSITLLFTDLKGSTALYDREGDLAAYRLVQDHFVALKDVVRQHSGAMIKTMGDAVMAAFPHGNDGAAAAIAMMDAMQALTGRQSGNEVGLKVGLHAGPALAINAGNSVDYFGQTVNIAARVQGLADAGDICVTGALNDNGDVPALLHEAGYSSHAELARLKGVSVAEQIYRYSSSP